MPLPSRLTIITVQICTLLGVFWPAGCTSVDPTADVRRTTGLVADRTGAADTYDPLADELAGQKVERLLEDDLTIDEAVQVALLNNRNFQAAFAEIGVSRAEVVQSALPSNPTVSLGLMFPEGGGRAKLPVGIGQQIADLWQIPIRRKIAEAQLEQTILSLAQRAVELAAEVKTTCYRLLALEQIVAVTRKNHDLAEQSVQLVRRQLEAGQASQLDVNLAQVSALDMEAELIQFDRDRRVTEAKLARLLGLAACDRPWQLKDKLPQPEAIPDEATLREVAMRQRLDAQVAGFQVRAAEEELRLQTWRVFPDLTLGFELERMEARALPGRHILADTARESVAAGQLTAPSIQSRAQRAEEKRQQIDVVMGPSMQATLPIWDQNQAQIAKARYRLLQEQKRLEELGERVVEEVQQASRTARSNHELLTFYTDRLMPQLEANIEASRRGYQAGQQNALTLLEAQRSLLSRRRDAVNVLQDYALAMAELERAVGGRLPASATAPAASEPAPPARGNKP